MEHGHGAWKIVWVLIVLLAGLAGGSAARADAPTADQAAAFVERAAGQEVQLVVFPECCITGYWFLRSLSREALEALAEPVPDGPSWRSRDADSPTSYSGTSTHRHPLGSA